MHPVKKHLFDTNFKDLEGTRIEGTIALSDELINLGIMDFLKELKVSSTAPASESASSAPAAAPDAKSLLAKLNIEKLQIKAVDGRIILKVKAGF